MVLTADLTERIRSVMRANGYVDARPIPSEDEVVGYTEDGPFGPTGR